MNGSCGSVVLAGFAVRFPGLGEWLLGQRVLFHGFSAGVDAGEEVASSRCDLSPYYNPEGLGPCYTQHGANVEDVEFFDCRTFRISPAEASSMAPE